jgi:hypothetical protein
MIAAGGLFLKENTTKNIREVSSSYMSISNSGVIFTKTVMIFVFR